MLIVKAVPETAVNPSLLRCLFILLKIFNVLVKILSQLTEIRTTLKLRSVVQQFENEELLDNFDAKRLLQIGDKTLYRWRREKLIPYRLIGNKPYYLKSDLIKMKKGK